jgi:AcrR family transcriptional regulator
MGRLSKNIKYAKGLRTGSAAFKKGKGISKEILKAASYILSHQGYPNFTLRNIANRVGISLGNLQYYYKTKDDLLRELLQYTNDEYDKDYSKIFSDVPDTPEDRFKIIVDYLLADTKNPSVRGFIFQVWALSTYDAYAEHCMEEMYGHYHGVIAGIIAELNPSLSKRDCNDRATIIQSLIEGSHYSVVMKHGKLVQRPGLDNLIKKRVFQIATR